MKTFIWKMKTEFCNHQQGICPLPRVNPFSNKAHINDFQFKAVSKFWCDYSNHVNLVNLCVVMNLLWSLSTQIQEHVLPIVHVLLIQCHVILTAADYR